MTPIHQGLAAALGVGLVVAAVAGLGSRSGASRTKAAEKAVGGPAAPPERTPYQPGVVDRTIDFWKMRAARDPRAALENLYLAGAYLTRHRETGDIADAVRAEEAARRSLTILGRENPDALLRLARALLAQHRFPEALEAATTAAALDPAAQRLVADVRIELGDYDAAETALDAAPPHGDDMNYDAVRARLEAVNGRPDASLRLFREAARLADSRPDLPAETAAWCHAMVGHALIDTGRFDEGEQECRAALAIFPRDYRALTMLAAAASWRGDWREAVERGDQALAICPTNPEALKLVGDAHAALGRDDEAKRLYDRFDAVTRSFPRVYDRHRILFLADRDRDLDEALKLARADLKLRHDVHAYDALAWVYFHKGMQAEAETAMEQALIRGTREATLFFHAGMIARGVGDPARAKDFFERARAINPNSVPRRWLRGLEAQAG